MSAPLTDRETEAPRGTGTPKHLIPFQEGHPCPRSLPGGSAPRGGRASPASQARGCRRPGLGFAGAPGSSLRPPAPGGLAACAQVWASPDFRQVVLVGAPQGRGPGLGGPVHGSRARVGRGGRAGSRRLGSGTRYVRRCWRLPPGEPARCLPLRPRGGAAPSRFSQLLPTPPAGRGREGATLLRGWGGGVTGTSWASREPNGQSPGVWCQSRTRTF